MSQATTTAPFMLESRGSTRELGAFVVAARFSRDASSVAFALGNGSLHIARPSDPGDWRALDVHAGAVLSLAPDVSPDGFVSGGDDGVLRRVEADGTLSDLGRFGMRWVEQVATHSLDKGKGLIAASVGKAVHLLDHSGATLKTWTHPSSVTGLAFDSKGKRVGASHYNGASLWFVGAKTDNARKLEWKGSHTGIAIHPDGEAVVTAMQENSLHGWRLSDGQHMRMSGYPSKTEALSFTRNGKWLASSGADSMVLWPFFGGGPMGKAPIELAGGDGIICSQVACHPKDDLVAGGFSDGLVVLCDITSARVLPVAPPGHGKITALAWAANGSYLAFGTESGFAAIVNFLPR